MKGGGINSTAPRFSLNVLFQVSEAPKNKWNVVTTATNKKIGKSFSGGHLTPPPEYYFLK